MHVLESRSAAMPKEIQYTNNSTRQRKPQNRRLEVAISCPRDPVVKLAGISPLLNFDFAQNTVYQIFDNSAYNSKVN
jgi:hypothetical protein